MAQASKVTFSLYLSTGQLIKKRYDFVHINKHCGLEGEKKNHLEYGVTFG